MLTEEERNWENNKDLTAEQKEFLSGMEYVRKEIVQSALWFWQDNNHAGFETLDKIIGELADDIEKSLDAYIMGEMDDVIVSMLESNMG